MCVNYQIASQVGTFEKTQNNKICTEKYRITIVNIYLFYFNYHLHLQKKRKKEAVPGIGFYYYFHKKVLCFLLCFAWSTLFSTFPMFYFADLAEIAKLNVTDAI